MTIVTGTYHAGAISLRGQTLGQRAMGIRVISQAGGGRPTARQAAVRSLINALPGLVDLVATRAWSGYEAQEQSALRALNPEIAALRQQHGEDPRRLNEALIDLYRERSVNPLGACLPSLLRSMPGLVCQWVLIAPALRGPMHQGIHDRIAKTVVVESSP